jgi:peptidoglycan/xylan/chitin deacetylase (PgdA/CDA1 family)
VHEAEREDAVVTAVRAAVKEVLMSWGLYARRLRQQVFPGVVVLSYHGLRCDVWPPSTMAFENLHVTVDTFEAHCRVLRDTCDPISLDDWRAARAGARPLPQRPVLITFDDGYRTVLTLGVPVLRRFGLPAAVFVCSAPARARTMLWFDAVARTDSEAAVEPLKGASYEEWAARAASLAVPTSDDDPHALLTPVEIATLSAIDGMEVGAHTANHPILASASLAVQRREILENKDSLEHWTARRVSAFAYPNGRPGVDYTRATVGLLAELGFDFAFSTRPEFARPSDQPLEYPRFLVLASVSATELTHRLCYSWQR